MGFAPRACTLTERPAECASSTAARSSGMVNSLRSVFRPGIRIGALILILMWFTPCHSSVRTAPRIPSAPSASSPRPGKWLRPAVICLPQT